MRKDVAMMVSTGVVVAALVGASRHRPTPDKPGAMLWYARLEKPAFRPSGPVIGVAWTILDGLLAFSGGRLLAAARGPARTTAVAGWGAAVLGLFTYPWMMFGRRRLGAALGAVVGMMGGTLVAVGAGASVDRRAAGALLPLVAWLGFAGVLQEEIWRRNRT